jgi:hypothetical protein
MRTIFILFTFIFFAGNVSAQIDKEPIPTPDADVIQLKTANSVFGRIVDIQNNKGIEAASVQLFVPIIDTVSHQTKDSLIAAMLSKPNGDFSFSNIPSFQNLKLQISAIGYTLYDHVFPFANDSATAQQKDLGNIIMSHEHEKLQAITIVAERPALKMGIDKKIFDVDKSITSKGGTALDVMKNIPSVSVDVDGNIELRNATPTIFIDGRPTILTLDQIASDDIERIELITNPSAKYDASSTGGIINIILKKNKRYGINGIVSASAGIPERFSGNANLNLRQGKFNFFVSSNYNYVLLQ